MTQEICATGSSFVIPQIKSGNEAKNNVSLNYDLIDEFVKTKNTIMCEKNSVDASLAKDDKNLIKVLQAEYDAIVEENFETKEEYEAAKAKAYERLQDAIQNANDRSNSRHETNTNCFTKIVDSISNFMKNIGMGILEYFFPKTLKLPTT